MNTTLNKSPQVRAQSFCNGGTETYSTTGRIARQSRSPEIKRSQQSRDAGEVAKWRSMKRRQRFADRVVAYSRDSSTPTVNGRSPSEGINVIRSRFCLQFRQHFIFFKLPQVIDFAFPFPNICNVIFFTARHRNGIRPGQNSVCGVASLPLSGMFHHLRQQYAVCRLFVRRCRCNLRRNTPSFPVSSRGDAVTLRLQRVERTAARRVVRIDPLMSGSGP